MKVRAFMLASVLMGVTQVVKADHTFTISADDLDMQSYVKVAEIRVNGVTADSVEEVSVPDGADVTVVFKNGRGYIWGNDTAVYYNVTEDIRISVLPKTLKSYMGTVSCPILIECTEDLTRILMQSDTGNSWKNVYFKQTADLDMSNYGPWKGIGKSTSFQGTYDGDGHRIDNLTLKNATRGGLFGRVAKATICNLTVKFSGFENPNRMNCGGAIVANSGEDVRYIHLIAEGTLSNVNEESAGIAVKADRGEMIGCTNRMTISGLAKSIGGLVACSGYTWSGKYKGMTYTDCANEGQLTNGSLIGATGGIVGQVSENQLTTCIRCASNGRIDSEKKGSLIGEYVASAVTTIAAMDCEASAELPPIAVIGEGVRTIKGLNFATVSMASAHFCTTPSAAGSFKVMLENSDPIVLTGVKPGDRLVLDDYEKYSGVVSCMDPALSVKGREGVWTVGKALSADAGSLVEGSTPGIFELQPLANQSSVTIEGFDGEQLKIPGTIEFIRGVDQTCLAVENAGYDVTEAVSFDGTAENGYVLTLDGTAVVNGIKVTPTIGEGVSDAFAVAGDVRIVIKAIPGLWYGLYRGSTPSAIDQLCEVKMAESDTVALADGMERMPGAYYKVKVTLSTPVKD